MSEMIVMFHHDERGVATSWDEVGKLVRCKDCQHWNTGNCNCPDIRVDCSDYYVGDIVTEEDFYCSYAKRRTDD